MSYYSYHERKADLMYGRCDSIPIRDPQDALITGLCENCGCELYDDEIYCAECEETLESLDAFEEEEEQ